MVGYGVVYADTAAVVDVCCTVGTAWGSECTMEMLHVLLTCAVGAGAVYALCRCYMCC